MASFYAELQVAGHAYPVRHCSHEFTQATDNRGRAVEKVRHGLVHLVLDVPDDDFLLDWANTPYKPLPGCIVFYETKGGAARETLAWAAGHCVGYREDFTSGRLSEGAYVCHVTLTAPKLTMQPGGPGRYVSPAPREHGTPQLALLGVPPTLATLPAEEVAAAVAPELLPLAPVLLPVAGMVAAVLALIVATTTPAQAPGLPVDPNLLRLRLLTAKHAAGTLTADEEAELIDLLAKVKGVRVKSLDDLGKERSISKDAWKTSQREQRINQQFARSYTYKTDEHIFKGTVHRTGVHHLDAVTSGNARLTGVEVSGPHGLFKSRLDIRDGNGNFGPKVGGGKSTFFPRSWNKSHTVAEIKGAYLNRQFIGRTSKSVNFEGVSPSGARIRFYTDVNTGEIISAFPLF